MIEFLQNLANIQKFYTIRNFETPWTWERQRQKQ